jgi:hypothetical protein
MFSKISLGVAVGSDFRPEDVMIASAHGVQEAGQPDDWEIEPSETLAVGSVSKLMLTNLITKDIPLPFTLYPWKTTAPTKAVCCGLVSPTTSIPSSKPRRKRKPRPTEA